MIAAFTAYLHSIMEVLY